MAVINQSPAGQPSQALVGLSFSSITITGVAPARVRRNQAAGPTIEAGGVSFSSITITGVVPGRVRRHVANGATVEAAIGAGGSVGVPTTGQIWPLGTF